MLIELLKFELLKYLSDIDFSEKGIKCRFGTLKITTTKSQYLMLAKFIMFNKLSGHHLHLSIKYVQKHL